MDMTEQVSRIAAPGAMADRVRAFSWARTPLGPIETWPDRLLGAVETMLATPQLATLAVGPERIFLYNDEASRHYGEHHPAALGMPLPDAFPHAFPHVAGFYDRVRAGESIPVPAQPLDILNEGAPEVFDAWLTPIRDTDGAVLAVYMTGVTIGVRLRAEAAVRRTEEHRRAELQERIDVGTAELQASRDLLRGTIDSSEDMIQVFEAIRDDAGEIVDFRWILNNHTSESRYGAVAGESLLQRNPGVLPEGGFDAFKRVTTTGVAERAERHYVHEQYAGWFYQSVVKLGDGVATTTKVIDDWKAAQAEILRLQAEAAEASLSASEERYRTLFDSIDQGFCVIQMIFDAGGRPVDYLFLEANAALYAQSGLADAVGKRMRQLAPDHEQHWFDTYGQVAVTGRPERFERHAAALGRWFDVYAFRTGEPDEHRVAILFSDISDRIQQDRALRDSRERFQALATAGNYSIYRMSPDWRLMYALNSETLAVTADPMVDWLHEYIPPDALPEVLAAIEEAIRTKSLFELEHCVRHADGTIGWVRSRAVPLLEPDGEIIEWFGVGTDVTERRRAADQLRESEKRQAFLLRLSERMRAERDAEKIIGVAARALGERLGASRVVFAEIDEEAGLARVLPGWTAKGREPSPTELRLDDFAGPMLDELRNGLPVRFDDVGEAPFARDDLKALHAIGVRAGLSMPLIVDGQLVLNLNVHQDLPRCWTDQETVLAHQVADRVWAALVRARAEAALRASEERFRQFGDASHDILWIRDAATLQWLYLTPAFEHIYGLSRDEVLTGDDYRNWQDLILPEDREHALRSIARVRDGEHVTFEFRIRRPSDGAVRWLRNTDFPITDDTGKVVLIGGIGRDFTEMREAEERFQTLVEGIPQLVWRGVDGGEWTWASPQWQDYTGQGEAEYRAWGWLDALHPNDRFKACEAWSHALEDGGFQVEYRLRDHADGSYRWFQTRATAVREEGDIVEWLGTSTDIHDLRELQERQRVLVAELQHRTRNLLGVVRSMGDKTVRASADLPDFRARFRDRLDALARVQGLLSRLNEHDRVTFDELVDTELAAMDGGLDRVTLDGPPGVRLRSSTVQTLAMALHELATNAVKYGALGQPAARLSISWRLESAGEDGKPWLHIDWRESGVAMPAADALPTGTGQGRELIERALPYQLSAKTSYRLGPDGARCLISIPVSSSGSEMAGHG